MNVYSLVRSIAKVKCSVSLTILDSRCSQFFYPYLKMPSKRKSTRPTKHTKKVKTDDTETPLPPVDEAVASGDGSEVHKKVLKESSKLGDKWNLKIISWNVDGLRAWVKKGGLQFFKDEDPDIVCLQETKCSEKQLPSEAKIDGYHMHWCSGKTEGYAGVGLYSKIKPLDVKLGINVEEHDQEGRVITAEFEKFYLVNAYIPNSGRGLKTLDYRMRWDADFHAYISKLTEDKSVILCGDLNVAHNEIDLANPKTNTKNAGFTKEERESFSKLLEKGYVDTFRHFYPEEKDAYTFWTYMRNSRSKNIGWRLDYFVVSGSYIDNICDNVILSKYMGSDHCPIALYLIA